MTTKQLRYSEKNDWTLAELEHAYDLCATEADDLGFDIYPNQLEVVSAKEMIDLYASNALPYMYPHWSFGKRALALKKQYKAGQMGLAYEVVINSNPCIAYLMRGNSLPMQTLVIAHACFGHNTFFKNNFLFKQHTDADTVLAALREGREYVLACEEKYGIEAVESVIDAAHSLWHYGVDRYPRKRPLTRQEIQEREETREETQRLQVNPLFNEQDDTRRVTQEAEEEFRRETGTLKEPDENLLRFIAENSPILEDWQREVIRIVAYTSTYFYPQMLTQAMNEGCATFTHYTILKRLYEKGLIDEGFWMKFLHTHTNVIRQLDYNHKYYGGSINPYAIGFALYRDVQRMVEKPTDEDREWFPHLMGRDFWGDVFKDIISNYTSESGIRQYLSPKVMRDFSYFAIQRRAKRNYVEVTATTNEMEACGYRALRKRLAAQHDTRQVVPQLEVLRADMRRDRTLTLRHAMQPNLRRLEKMHLKKLLYFINRLWGHKVVLEEHNPYKEGGDIRIIGEYPNK